jgi:hypothetical protein
MDIPSMMLPAVTLKGSTHPVAPYRVWPPPLRSPQLFPYAP